MTETAQRPIEHWIDRYDAMYTARRYPVAHAMAATLLIVGVLCGLWLIPVPAALSEISALLNWSTALLLALVVYYFILSLPLALALLPVIVMLAVMTGLIARASDHLALISVTLVAMSLCLDIAGMRQKSLRGLANFVQLGMLAPIWLFHHAVQRRE